MGKNTFLAPIQMRRSYKREYVDVFYGADLEGLCALCSLSENIETYQGRIPPEFVPIAGNGFGDQFCLVVRDSECGKVYLWDHEDERTQETYSWQYGEGKTAPNEWLYGNVYLVASSLEDFLTRLEPAE